MEPLVYLSLIKQINGQLKQLSGDFCLVFVFHSGWDHLLDYQLEEVECGQS